MFTTKEDAIEAWNTWKGRYQDIDRQLLLKNNLCNYCGEIVSKIKNHIVIENNDKFGGSSLLPDGSFSICWPKLPPKFSVFTPKDIDEIFLLRARWCFIFANVLDYRQQITDLILSNDRDNLILNTRLQNWNKILTQYQLPLFEKNDLRGCNLSGLILSKKGHGSFLRYIDFSYSELSVVDLYGANIYGSSFRYIDAYNANFSNTILNKSLFDNCLLSSSYFNSSDLHNSKFSKSILYKSCLHGAILNSCEMTNCNLSESSFLNLKVIENGYERIKFTEFSELSVRDCKLGNVILPSDNNIISNKFTQLVIKYNQKNNCANILYKALELKPNLFGIGLDIKLFIQWVLKLFRN